MHSDLYAARIVRRHPYSNDALTTELSGMKTIPSPAPYAAPVILVVVRASRH